MTSTHPNFELSEEWFDDTQEKVVSVKSTRPNINSSEKLINNTQEKFVPVLVDRTTIQRCRDKKCSKLHRILSLLLCRPWRRNKGSTRPNLDSSENLFNSSSIGSTRPNLDSSENLFNSSSIGSTRPSLDSSENLLNSSSIGSTRPNLDSSENLLKSSSTGSTNPNLNSSEKLFNTTQQDFVSVVNQTLQGYSDQNLSINKLHLDLSSCFKKIVALKEQEREEREYLVAVDDRISVLPMPILHHILSFLSQKEAVRTSLLSKQWRHIGSTRPNLDFSEEWFNSTQENFVSVVNRTLQGYSDQNLSINKLHLDFSSPDLRPVISLLEKWIPMIAALNIKSFKLNFRSYTWSYYGLPSAVFIAESLEELHLFNCRVSLVESVLRTLILEWVRINDGTLEKIMLGCPLLSRLVLNCCWELRNIRLSEAASPGLKHFELYNYIEMYSYMKMEGRSIEINAPNLETVSIKGSWIWSHRQSTFLFSRLTILDLNEVILSSESFDLLSFRCQTLENLTLNNCSGFEEFHLASDSVVYLNISTRYIPLKGVTICAPNIRKFTFNAHIPQVPDTFSFTTTTSKGWDSDIFLYSCEDDPDFDVNSWFLELRRMLKALSGSRISLFLQMDGGPEDVPCSAVVGDEPPVVLWSLKFDTCKCRTASWYLEFTNGLFRVCRPSQVWGGSLVSQSDRKYRLSEFQLNMLLASKNARTQPYFWWHDLEQVQVNGQLVQWTNPSELRNRTYGWYIWLYLKWRC